MLEDEWKEVPCRCGFTPEKNKSEFEVYLLRMGTFMGQEIPKKPVQRCKTCKSISIIHRVENIMSDDEVYKGMSPLKEIVEKKQIPIPSSFTNTF